MLQIILRGHGAIVGMRMIKADDIQSFVSRVFLAAQKLFGSNQKSISFGFFFPRVRNLISLSDDLTTRSLKSAQHQAAAFERVVAFTVFANLDQVLFVDLEQVSLPAVPPDVRWWLCPTGRFIS